MILARFEPQTLGLKYERYFVSQIARYVNKHTAEVDILTFNCVFIATYI